MVRPRGQPLRWSTWSARCLWSRLSPSRLRPGSKGTGESRTGSAGSGTWSSTRTATSCAPVTAPRSWPSYATWPSASSAWSTAPAPASPRPPDPCHDNQNQPSSSSPSQAPDPILPPPCPRDRQGVRHDLPTVLSLAVTGVLAGCRSLTAIWEHATDLTGADLRSLGVEAGQALP